MPQFFYRLSRVLEAVCVCVCDLPYASAPESSLVGYVCLQEAAIFGSGKKRRALCHRWMDEASGSGFASNRNGVPLHTEEEIK